MEMSGEARGHVLQRLARAEPASLLRPDRNGARTLGNVYIDCCNVGLTHDTAAATDTERLQALFTVATDHGLAHFVTDYLAEVCLNESITSR